MSLTQVVESVSIVIALACLVVLYNWAPYWEFSWFPKTRLGQLFWFLGALGAVLVYVVCAYTVYAPTLPRP